MESVLALAEVPKGVERAFISHLQEGEGYVTVFVVGDVVVLHPHYAGDPEEPDSARIKMILREPETGKQFAALVFGQASYSVSCNVNKNTRVALSGFRTETHHWSDASLILVLSRTSHYRIWEVAERKAFAYESPTAMFTSARRKLDFYAVVRSSNYVDKKSKTATIDLADTSVTSFTCRIKNCPAKMAAFSAEAGDVLRVRGARILECCKKPTVVAMCENVAVFKRRSFAPGKAIEAFSPHSNVKLDIRDEEEIDTVIQLFTGNEQQQREPHKKEKFGYSANLDAQLPKVIGFFRKICAWDDQKEQMLREKRKPVDKPNRWMTRPSARLSSIAVLHSVDVFCVVVAVHHVTTSRSHVCLVVWDGTVPAFVTPSQPSTPPAGSQLIRQDEEACRLFGFDLVSVSVLPRTWSRVAAALPLGAHVRLNGLSVRRDKRENRYWIVLDRRTSKQGLQQLSSPCHELMQSITALKNGIRQGMDVTKRAEVLSENKGKAALLDNTLQKQQHSDTLHSECGSEDELF